ncbi:MAG: sensor histidine kinase [Myxococcales bacterium]|nr:sensor histidine kinase [Myxococcales bacterium]MCB9628552.1 sensor histidine kinase [Sandaracinaceae bacterium]
MQVRDFIEPIHIIPDAATLADIAEELSLGVPHFIRTETGLRALTAAASIGHALTRRVIDLPSTSVPSVNAESEVEVMLASPSDLMSVEDSSGVLGYVDRRTVLSALADGVDPAALDVLLLTRMLPTLIHDLSNSLAVAGLTLNRLSANGVPNVDSAVAAVNHASMLLRRASDLSTGVSEGPPPAVSICATVRGFEGTLRSVLGQRVTLELGLPPGEPEVLAYPRLIERTLLNLTLNARDALVTGGVVQVRVDASMPRYVALLVEDDGPGVPEELVETLFDAGVSSNLGPKRGLGLASVRQSLHRVGGTISVGRSRLGGASFRIRLPRPQ